MFGCFLVATQLQPMLEQSTGVLDAFAELVPAVYYYSSGTRFVDPLHSPLQTHIFNYLYNYSPNDIIHIDPPLLQNIYYYLDGATANIQTATFVLLASLPLASLPACLQAGCLYKLVASGKGHPVFIRLYIIQTRAS